VLRFWHFWAGKDRELHHRTGEGEITEERQRRKEEYCNVYPRFLKRLKDAGALGIQEFHLSGEPLWDFYTESNEEERDDSDDFFTL